MEMLDLYDDERKLTGKVIERGNKCNKGEYRLVVHICIFNSNGEMLIQKRQPCKKAWPGKWDITLGGCVVSGETSKEAAHRELLEELGIDYDFTNIRPYFTINFEGGFDDFYIVNMDVDINSLVLQDSEVQKVKWSTKEEILELRKAGEFIPYYESFLSALFELKNKRGLY